jgi:hypothetical protein
VNQPHTIHLSSWARLVGLALLLAGAMVCPLALWAAHAHAAAFEGKAQPARPTLSLNASGAVHFLYVDDGSCYDSIDVYRITSTGLVHVGNYPTGGCQNGLGYGTQTIAASPATKSHGPCLAYIENGGGFVDSFPINADGSLGAQVSHLADRLASDLHLSPTDQIVYVDSNPLTATTFTSYSLGAGCVLTELVSLPTTSNYFTFTLINAKRLVASDVCTGSAPCTIDTYALTSTGGISLLNSVPGQLNFTDVMAALTTHSGTDVFTDQLGASHAQGGQENLKTGAITFLSGSPAIDPSGNDGQALLGDADHLLLVQGEQFSGSLGVYKITPGQPGSMAFLQHVPLAVASDDPFDFARLDTTLFVNGGYNSDVEACLISSEGVSGCATVAIPTDRYVTPMGLSVL